MYHRTPMPYSGHESAHQAIRPPPLSIPNHAPPRFSQYSISPSPANPMHVHQSQMPQQVPPQVVPQGQPQSPSETSERTANEEDYFCLPGPPPVSHVWEGRIWTLEVKQHPKRARMCGFGDKDRRPISPPPCIQLIIRDAKTKEEVDPNDIDLTHLVLTVDIWDLYGLREMNLVKQSNASPCISSAAAGAYPATVMPIAPGGSDSHRTFELGQLPTYNQNFYGARPSNYPQRQSYPNNQAGHPSPYQNAPPTYTRSNFPQPFDSRYGQTQAPAAAQPFAPQMPQMNVAGGAELGYMSQGPASTQMYTRNLIGSLCASAFRLKDENDKAGIWFVLQDLSVRTEGWFRLKMSFFNIKQAVQKQLAEGMSGPSMTVSPADNKEIAPCLASVFSSPFRVYSAKKFPGVVESTPLSKAFANQGIKIPIRKDTGTKRGRDESEDENSDG